MVVSRLPGGAVCFFPSHSQLLFIVYYFLIVHISNFILSNRLAGLKKTQCFNTSKHSEQRWACRKHFNFKKGRQQDQS